MSMRFAVPLALFAIGCPIVEPDAPPDATDPSIDAVVPVPDATIDCDHDQDCWSGAPCEREPGNCDLVTHRCVYELAPPTQVCRLSDAVLPDGTMCGMGMVCTGGDCL